MTSSQIFASISYLDPEPQRAPAEDAEILSIQAASYKAVAEQLRDQAMRLKRQRDNARFLAAVAVAAAALAWAAWWAGR